MKDTGVEVHAGEGLQVCRYMHVKDYRCGGTCR